MNIDRYRCKDACVEPHNTGPELTSATVYIVFYMREEIGEKKKVEDGDNNDPQSSGISSDEDQDDNGSTFILTDDSDSDDNSTGNGQDLIP